MKHRLHIYRNFLFFALRTKKKKKRLDLRIERLRKKSCYIKKFCKQNPRLGKNSSSCFRVEIFYGILSYQQLYYF